VPKPSSAQLGTPSTGVAVFRFSAAMAVPTRGSCCCGVMISCAATDLSQRDERLRVIGAAHSNAAISTCSTPRQGPRGLISSEAGQAEFLDPKAHTLTRYPSRSAWSVGRVPVVGADVIRTCQNMPLGLAARFGTSWMTSQCSTTLPSSRRKKSASARPGLSALPGSRSRWE
jgi:hypothetical protein